jgi:hypothetical protein
VSENTVLRRIFGQKRDDVTERWRKLHNNELHDLYSSPSIISIIKSRRMRLAGHVDRIREKRNAYRLLVGKPEGKRPPGRPRRRWMDNIKAGSWRDTTGCCGLDWSDSGQGQMESSCDSGNEPSGSIKFWETIKLLHNLWPLE